MSTNSLRWAVLPAARYASLAAGERQAGHLHWARLGDSTFVWAAGDRATDEVGRLGIEPAQAGGLALVTQVGRSLQNAHPHVRVLLDHGRHLVVDSATLPAVSTDPDCWRVEPLPADLVVVDRPAVAAERTDPAVDGLLSQLSPSAYESDLGQLVGFGTRHSLSQGFANAAVWAAGRLGSLGYATSRQPITVGSGHSENVVADRTGIAEGARGLVLVTAHLDSVNLAGGPSAPAPGADDNGSGSAGLLELGRIIATRAWQRDFRLILFGGEEQGLHGSRQYVNALPAGERARVRAVLNMDMVATRNTVQPAVLLEGAPVSSGLIDELAVAAATYTGLRVETSLAPFASDHVPFIDAGVPAVLTIEGADSANGAIHTDQDVLSRIDLVLMQEILRMNLAALAGWLGSAVSSPRPAGSVVASGPGRLDVFMVGSDAAMYHKAWDGTAWLPDRTGFHRLGDTVIST